MSVHGLQRKGFYGEYKKSYFLLSSMDGHSSLNLDKWDVPKQCQKTRGGKYISKNNFNFTPKQAELLNGGGATLNSRRQKLAAEKNIIRCTHSNHVNSGKSVNGRANRRLAHL